MFDLGQPLHTFDYDKLKEEVNFLEGMIDYLLLSDRLSMPYSNLIFTKILCMDFINRLMDLFPVQKILIYIDVDAL